MTTEVEVKVRAVYRVFPVLDQAAPYDRINAKIFYPGVMSHGEEAVNMGVIPVFDVGKLMPIVILMPGMNVGPESYQWLALHLAREHCIVVTYSYFSEELPGYAALSPGIDIEALKPEKYGTCPSASILSALMDGIRREAQQPFFNKHIDINTIILGGHSAGGSVAMLNNREDWFAGVKAAFTYGAHAGAATLLGYPESSYYELPTTSPLLLIGGERDGVINASYRRYSKEESKEDKLQHTFQQAFQRGEKDSFLAIIKGANHFTFAHPVDTTTGRHFLDQEQTHDGNTLRYIIANLISDFIKFHTHQDVRAEDRLLTRLNSEELIAYYECK